MKQNKATINKRQRAARQLTNDFMGYLTDQEQMVERIVERRLADLQPQIEEMVRRQVAEVLGQKQTIIK